MTFQTLRLALRDDGEGLVLGDHKLTLGAAGLEMGDIVERYSRANVWTMTRWHEKIRCDSEELVMLRPEGLCVLV